jgi:hypothetical protein
VTKGPYLLCREYLLGFFICYDVKIRYLPKVKVKQSRYTPWRRLGERRYSSYSFTTSALDRGQWWALRPGRAFTPGTHCTGGWVGPRAGLDTEDRGKILFPCRGSNPDRQVVQPVVRHYTDWATRLPPSEAQIFITKNPLTCMNSIKKTTTTRGEIVTRTY